MRECNTLAQFCDYTTKTVRTVCMYVPCIYMYVYYVIKYMYMYKKVQHFYKYIWYNYIIFTLIKSQFQL